MTQNLYAADFYKALQDAYLSNPELNAERKNFESAKQSKNISRSEFLPNITLSGDQTSTTSTNRTNQSGSNLADSNSDSESKKISVEQKIFSGFKGINTFKKSELETQKANLSLKDVEQQTILDTASGYFDLIFKSKSEQFNLSNVNLFERQVESDSARLQKGEITLTDLAQSESSLAGAKANLIKADLSSAIQVRNLIPKINKKYGQLSMLINNASIFEKDDIKSISSELWDKHIDVNLKAPLFLSKDFANQFSKRKGGIIINFLDQSVLTYRPNFISYSVSKNSLWYLTRSLAQALSPRIRVCAIGPGPTLQGKRQTKKDFETQKKVTPLGIGPNLEEINNAINFIIKNNSFTGQMIVLDGGEHLKWEESKDKKFVE